MLRQALLTALIAATALIPLGAHAEEKLVLKSVTADLPFGADRDDSRRDSLEDGFDVLPPFLDFEVLVLEVQTGAFELALTRGELPRHRVERFDERAELVACFGLDAVIQPSEEQPGGIAKTAEPIGVVQRLRRSDLARRRWIWTNWRSRSA